MAARIFELEKQTAQNPQSAEAWIQLGNLYFDTDNNEKAIGAYQNSLALKPDNANVLTDMGVMYRRSGKPAEAIKAFSKAIAVDPRHEVSRFNKGIVLMHDLKDREGALKAWEGLLEINPLAMAPNGQSVDQLIQHYREHLKK
jgi:cytochrome c-type biogenesis protein CcmH/NrfG